MSDRNYLFDIADKRLQANFKELKYSGNDSSNRLSLKIEIITE